jgi:dTDP-4-dehydrorhamnose reductase
MNALRIAVTGTKGQVALSLLEKGAEYGAHVITIGRPEIDFDKPDTIQKALIAAQPNVIVNAAAYTAVDQAEREEIEAFRHNRDGAEQVAIAAAALGVPVVHLSTDYVFDGELSRPYREDDNASPTGVYGHSKWAGEKAVTAVTKNHVILRTAWVYSPFGKNFVKTMLSLGLSREEVSIVADQIGNPTYALDMADGILTVAKKLCADPEARSLRGIFHLTGEGAATWADLAEAIFDEATLNGRNPVKIKRITTAEYPTLSRRPKNSQLDGSKLVETYGFHASPWRISIKQCVQRLLTETNRNGQ